jgi:hypothetical protein
LSAHAAGSQSSFKEVSTFLLYFHLRGLRPKSSTLGFARQQRQGHRQASGPGQIATAVRHTQQSIRCQNQVSGTGNELTTWSRFDLNGIQELQISTTNLSTSRHARALMTRSMLEDSTKIRELQQVSTSDGMQISTVLFIF